MSSSKQKRSKFKIGRGLWAFFGFISFALGAVGTVLPILPTTPLILLAGYCFARSSKSVEDWFKQTKLYHTVFKTFVENKTMPLKTKKTILITISIQFPIAGFLVRSTPIACVILAIVYFGLCYYFIFGIPTEHKEINVQPISAESTIDS